MKLQGQMVAIQLQAFVQIQAMRGVALIPAVQMQLIASLGPALSNQPIQEKSPVSRSAFSRKGNQVVHVQDAPPGHEFQNPKPRGAYGQVAFQDVRQSIPLPLLPAHLGDKTRLCQMRAQTFHWRKTRRDFRVRTCEKDFHLHDDDSTHDPLHAQVERLSFVQACRSRKQAFMEIGLKGRSPKPPISSRRRS
jgi:hypothetical protein